MKYPLCAFLFLDNTETSQDFTDTLYRHEFIELCPVKKEVFQHCRSYCYVLFIRIAAGF